MGGGGGMGGSGKGEGEGDREGERERQREKEVEEEGKIARGQTGRRGGGKWREDENEGGEDRERELVEGGECLIGDTIACDLHLCSHTPPS